MHIIRFIDPDGAVRLGTEYREGSAALLEGDLFTGPAPTGERARVTRLLAPLDPVAIFGIGLNYRAHAEETGRPLPERPVVFMKNPAALQHPEAPIVLPRPCLDKPQVDFEVELALVVGRAARDVEREEALDYLAGYTVGNDVSARRWQKKGGGGQWVRGKSFDTFCPLGPCLVTREALPDPQGLALRTHLNGRLMQSSSTRDMVFSAAELVAELSRGMTLLPGTVILTGTPSGVGYARTPPVYLQPGDRVTVEVEGIGALTNPVVAQEG